MFSPLPASANIPNEEASDPDPASSNPGNKKTIESAGNQHESPGNPPGSPAKQPETDPPQAINSDNIQISDVAEGDVKDSEKNWQDFIQEQERLTLYIFIKCMHVFVTSKCYW